MRLRGDLAITDLSLEACDVKQSPLLLYSSRIMAFNLSRANSDPNYTLDCEEPYKCSI